MQSLPPRFVRKRIRYNATSVMCNVVEALDGGTAAKVSIDGEAPMDRVPCAPKTTVMTGDRRIMYYAENNRNLPFIIGDYASTETEPVVIPTSTWNQFHQAYIMNRKTEYDIMTTYSGTLTKQWTLTAESEEAPE